MKNVYFIFFKHRSGMYLAWLEDDIENEYVATQVMSGVNQYWIGEFSSFFFFIFLHISNSVVLWLILQK